MPASVVDNTDFQSRALRRDLAQSDKGNVLPSLANIETILRRDPRWQDVLSFNALAEAIEKRAAPPYEGAAAGGWSDVDEVRTQIWMAKEYGFNARVTDVRHAVHSAARFRTHHPVRDYLEALAWDGTPRIAEFALTYLGADDSGDRGLYHMSACEKWLVSAVARVFRPGCKADNVLILEGEQGRFKSTALAVLGGEWFTDTPFELGGRDAFLMIQGRWIVELAELDGFSRAESSRAKAFFSSPRDRYVPKYVANAINVERQCVFAGTVNHGTYLHDRTGNRRYWPVKVGRIDVEALRRDRDQLWAEAVVRFREGVRWWVAPHEVPMFRLEQEARELPDALEELLETWLGTPANLIEPVTMKRLMDECLCLGVKDWTHALQTRVGQILSRLGWEQGPRKRDEAGKRDRCYVLRTDSEAAGPASVQPGPTSAEVGPAEKGDETGASG